MNIKNLIKNQKLTENEVKEIKLLLKRGLTMAVLSETFGVHIGTVQAIKNFRSWRKIKP